MRRITVLIFGALMLAACGQRAQGPVAPPPEADQSTARSVSTGDLVGYVDAGTGAHVWRSVPFAAPPVDDLRWRAPRPAAAWADPLQAVQPAPWCPQALNALDGLPQDRWGELAGQEDCLYLDIYAPPATQSEALRARRPVMVWIHGGGNVWGRAEQYDASALATRHDLVVVVVQYRLGPIGWFAHPALRAAAQGEDDKSANFGTLDQIAALEWVRDEITNFGGDPERVTIFGESAGGHNVAALMASPRAGGLFHRAIIQSGSFRSTPLGEAEGSDGFRPDAGMHAAIRITGDAEPDAAALRAASLEEVYAAYDTQRGAFDPPRVIADGVTLPRDGVAAAFSDRDDFNDVPVITGANRDEMKLFNLLNPAFSKRLFGLFPMARNEAIYLATSDYQSRMWRVSAVDDPATAMRAAGHDEVWAYRFDWDEEGRVGPTDLGLLLGAGHSVEIPFVFGRFRLLGAFDRYAFTAENEEARLKLSDAMMSYWAAFAADGEPGRGVGGDLPEWTAWSNKAGADRLMILDTDADGGLRMSSDRVTAESVEIALLEDPTLESAYMRCSVYKATAAWRSTTGFDRPEAAGCD